MLSRTVLGLGVRSTMRTSMTSACATLPLKVQLRFASSSLPSALTSLPKAMGGSTGSAFGKSNADSAWWFAKAAAASAVLGVTISTFVLTDERMEPVVKSTATAMAALRLQAKRLGLDLPMLEAHAFSTADAGLHASHWPWEHNTWWTTFDHSSLRRGYQVYREICAACHSMDYIYWRNLVGVTHTENEAKAMAAEYEYRDGPDDKGEFFMRPGKLSDPMPRPYPNEEAARAVNGGAYPPDLSCIVRARHGDADYIMSLLLGYCDAPAGVSIREGLHYNPYFPGGAIGMARALYDEVVDYEDGTPNNASQLAKDVTQFLSWSSYPEHDERKKMGLKTMAVTATILCFAIWWKRFKWSHLKSKKYVFKPTKLREV
ncbi:hypothetical protein BASA50_000020 [Batrachochytrium salamandrivorans]|uniref:quinol--cytochrome-c reductase n=1 Tax=Batrachochytrium salamandrivorans TaxID=1357716 RepID=A0ABQ8EXF6_9FUNG|nr:hypothetical protein BASA62_001339 [Batrachochytrium salamandrivorans]KAH6576740.1 hypothetical protein BASA60_004374 [Batrachochytrium salamandrivorans]KAH6586971.1 hypothetical protein BASA50_000020 [Batrachochytrium salamandrivorans]KAH6589702.1 hypothetical protein BASA61_005515 [Batrachochytrium salamandrivorans]KAH9249113.1 hypothetical protein BASA81_013186 [Batrachochytrium salamandrivorans]